MTKLWMKIAEAIYKNLSKGNDILLNCNLKFAKREPNIPGRPHKLQIFSSFSSLVHIGTSFIFLNFWH